MNDHLANLSARIADPAACLRPRLPSFFEPVMGFPALFGSAAQPQGPAPGDISDSPLIKDESPLRPLAIVRRGYAATVSHLAPHSRPSVRIVTHPPLAHDHPESVGSGVGMAGTPAEGTRSSSRYMEITHETQIEGGWSTVQNADDAHGADQPGDNQQWERPAAEEDATVDNGPLATDDISVKAATTASQPLQDGQLRSAAPQRPLIGVPLSRAPHLAHEAAPSTEAPHPPSDGVPPLETSRKSGSDDGDPRSSGTAYQAPGPKPQADGFRRLQPDGAGRAAAANPAAGARSDDATAENRAHHRTSVHKVPNPSLERLKRSTSSEPAQPAMPWIGRSEHSALPNWTPEPPGDAAPVVHVTIGRIEVRVPSPRPAASTPRTAPPPVMSLDDYVRQRAKERGQ
jgi:hypothetical protein